MMEQLDKVEKRYKEIDEKLSQPEVATDIDRVQELSQERARLEDVVLKYRRYKKLVKELDDVKSMNTAGND
jgi:peptide chain release factor 1